MAIRAEPALTRTSVAVFRGGARCDPCEIAAAGSVGPLLRLAAHRRRHDEAGIDRLVLTLRARPEAGLPAWTLSVSGRDHLPGGLSGWTGLADDIRAAIDRLASQIPRQEDLCFHVDAAPLSAHDVLAAELRLRASNPDF